MSQKNYRYLGGVLEHVLETIQMVHAMGFWMEVVTLIVPGWNDSEEELQKAAEFLVAISPDIPWHITAFHKDYKMTDPDNTPADTLLRAARIGQAVGLRYVYAGNLPGRVGKFENTYCPTCKDPLIARVGFLVTANRLTPSIQMVHAMGFWMEVVTLIVPGWNDSEEELQKAAEFLVAISPDIPWHITAFHKDYKMTDPDNTPADTLLRAARIGQAVGLRYVYAGNLPGRVGKFENTYCPTCKDPLIARVGFLVTANRLTPSGTCPSCDTKIPGIWA